MERALCSANLAYAQTAFPLTGAARNSFIQSALKTCAPGLQNFGLSADKVEQICSCYANAMADNFNASEVMALVTGQVPDSFREKAKSATVQCVSKAR